MSGHKFIDSLKKGLFQRGILKWQILLQGLLIYFSFIAWKCKNTLNFRSKYKVSIYFGIVHRLNSKEIPCKHQSLLFFIPYCKPKHSPELIQCLLTILLNGIYQNFRVRMGTERNAGSLKFCPQFLIIIDFPIKNNMQVSVRTFHRLLPIC